MSPSRKKPPKNPLTPQDEQMFDAYMDKWRTQLNLRDWRYVKDSKKSKDMAEIVHQDTKNRYVRWRVGAEFGDTPVTQESLEQTAIHENLHVLLNVLIETAIEEGEYSDAVAAAEHGVIAVLETLLHRLAKFDELVSNLKEPADG